MSDRIKILLDVAEERHRRYGRRAALLEWLYLVLLISASAIMFLGAVVHLHYGYDYRPLYVVTTALWAAGYVTCVLYIIYDIKANEAARQACELRCMLEHES